MTRSKESERTYEYGLLPDNEIGPPEISVPNGFPLRRCYRLDPNRKNANPADAANAHLLAALGKLDTPFVPVRLAWGYDESSLRRLPAITQVEVSKGNVLHTDDLWGGTVTCVDSLRITVRTSDGRVFASPVCIAVAPYDSSVSGSHRLFVTPAARKDGITLWYHLGGLYEADNPADPQAEEFDDELRRFWAGFDGPDEPLRQEILAGLRNVKRKWQSVVISSGGTVTIRFLDGSEKTIRPARRRGLDRQE